jgi:hypothetical protein
VGGLGRRALLAGAAACAAPFVKPAAEERPIRIGVLNDPNGACNVNIYMQVKSPTGAEGGCPLLSL